MTKPGDKREYEQKPCADCGRAMKVAPIARKSQRYCFLCRLARAAQWHDGRKHSCSLCGKKYIAWTGFKSMPRCGACFIEAAPLGGRESIEGVCGWSKNDPPECLSDPPATVVYCEGVNLCWPCLTDPAKFKDNRLAILGRYRELTAAANDGTVE